MILAQTLRSLILT